MKKIPCEGKTMEQGIDRFLRPVHEGRKKEEKAGYGMRNEIGTEIDIRAKRPDKKAKYHFSFLVMLWISSGRM